MKLKLIRQVFTGDRESWRKLTLFEVVEGANYVQPPECKSYCDATYHAVYDELALVTKIGAPSSAHVTAEVATRLGVSAERVRELRYWPEVEDWHSEVLSAAREEGVEVSDAGDGYPGGPFAREPAIDWWPHAWDGQAKATMLAHLTIEQSGGLDT